MKKIKFIICVIISVSIVVISLSDINSQSNNHMKQKFYLGPFNFYFLNILRTDTHKQWYKDLNYNTMQSYCAHLDNFPDEWVNTTKRDGGFFEDISNYAPAMRGVITDWKQTSDDNSLIFEREKILRPAYGQQSIYQAEDPGTWKSKFPGYGYCDTTVKGINYTEGNVSGRKCIKSMNHQSGFMVKGLYENREQVNDTRIIPDNYNSDMGRFYSDIKQPKYYNRWYIKPRMRIDSTYAKENPDTAVVMVYIRKLNGKCDSTLIKCLNFLDGNNAYDGRYLERYYHYEDPNISDTTLSVLGSKLAERTNNDPMDSVDYMVKWLGKVDVWLDYVKVEDSWSHYLFTDTWTEGGTYPVHNQWHFRERIKQEVDAFKNTPGLGYFWVDELQFSSIACLGEVNKLVKQYSGGNLSVLTSTDPIIFQGVSGMKNIDSFEVYSSWKWDTCFNYLTRHGALTDIMMTSWYPFTYWTRYPGNLQQPNPTIFPGTARFERAANYDAYMDANDGRDLQYRINVFLFQHKYFIKKAKSLGLIYATSNQINSDEAGITATGGWGLREPTNEEISLVLNTSLAYGSKILFEFLYTSRKGYGNDTNKYMWGLTTPEPDYAGKRLINYYGQHKWESVKALNRRIMNMANVMYPPNDTNKHLKHEKTITVNPLPVNYQYNPPFGLPYSYITGIQSLAPLRNKINNCMDLGNSEYYDCPDKLYWEIGFFNVNQNSGNPDDKSKYFLAVNKRTYPNITSDGDLRILKIKFEPNNLSGFTNWKLIDAVNDSTLAVFNKNTAQYISAGLFQPGEGRLFRIAPVIKED